MNSKARSANAGDPGLEVRPEMWCQICCEKPHDITPQALTQVGEGVSSIAINKRQTGGRAASAASKVLSNPKSTKVEKTAAASALSQTPRRGKK